MKKVVVLILMIFSLHLYSQSVIDKGHFFEQPEVKKLDSLFTDFQQKTAVPILLYTIPYLDGYTTDEYVHEFIYPSQKLPKKPLNNNLVILMSKEEHKINMIPAYGLEWLLPNQNAKRIIDQMVAYFINRKMIQGFEKGIEILTDQFENVSWKVVEKQLDNLKKKDVGNIIKFNYKNLTYKPKNESEENWDYYEETDPDAPQFSKDYQLKIASQKGDFTLYYSKNMNIIQKT